MSFQGMNKRGYDGTVDIEIPDRKKLFKGTDGTQWNGRINSQIEMQLSHDFELTNPDKTSWGEEYVRWCQGDLAFLETFTKIHMNFSHQQGVAYNPLGIRKFCNDRPVDLNVFAKKSKDEADFFTFFNAFYGNKCDYNGKLFSDGSTIPGYNVNFRKHDQLILNRLFRVYGVVTKGAVIPKDSELSENFGSTIYSSAKNTYQKQVLDVFGPSEVRIPFVDGKYFQNGCATLYWDVRRDEFSNEDLYKKKYQYEKHAVHPVFVCENYSGAQREHYSNQYPWFFENSNFKMQDRLRLKYAQTNISQHIGLVSYLNKTSMLESKHSLSNLNGSSLSSKFDEITTVDSYQKQVPIVFVNLLFDSK